MSHQPVDAQIVEAHAVDDSARLRDAEQSRARIAGLRPGRDRAHFDEAEAERGERIDVLAVLVQPGGQTDWIGKFEPHRLHRRSGDLCAWEN